HRQHCAALCDRGIRALSRRRGDAEPLPRPRLGATLPRSHRQGRDPALPLFLRVAETIARDWNAYGNCALVTGATWPEELGQVRDVVGDMPLLVPGIGAQGGDVAAVLQHGLTANGAGLMISSSRAILYAGSGEDFARAARAAAMELRDSINHYRS